MSLLTVSQDVADVVGLTRPTAIVNGSDQLARQLLGLARETLEELSLMPWPILQVPYTFSTVVDQQSYALPADFGYEVGDTVYDTSSYYQLRGSLTAGDWARQRNGLPSELGRFKYRIFGVPLKLYITPTPTAVDSITLEYVTTSRVKQIDGTYKTTFYSDDDVPLVAEDLLRKGLKWRIRHAKGMDYSEEFDDYESARTSRLAQQMSLGSMPVGYRNLLDVNLSNGYVPENGYGS